MVQDATASQTAVPRLSSTTSRPTTPLPKHQQPHSHVGSSRRMQYRSRPISVAIDPASLVISECIAITSAIQKHGRSPHSSVSAILGGGPSAVTLRSPVPNRDGRGGSRREPSAANVMGSGTNDLVRWGLRGKKGKSLQDNPLVSAFGKLRHELTSVKDMRKFDSLTLLYPFLQIIQTKGTAAPVTVLALRAIRKFLAYGFISPESERFPEALHSLSAAITHCQFDISDSTQGEVVLLMILHLMEDMLSGPGGDILSDESVCDMMGRGLTICSRTRFSEVLRRSAEASMVRMCQIIFEDLKHLEAEAGDDSDALDKKTNGDMDHVKLDPLTNGTDVATTGTEGTAVEPRPSTSGESIGSSGLPAVAEHTDSSRSSSVDLKPYSLPSVRELFRVLVNFLDPHEKKHPDQMRVMALRIIHVALEVAGPSIARHPALATIAEDKLCCYLFQLVRSDNMAILQESLIVASTLLATCRGVLKLQQELFLSYLVACLHPAVDIPREAGIDPSLYAGIPQVPKLVKPVPAQPGGGRVATPVPVQDRRMLGLEGNARKPEARQAMVENIGVLARLPTFMVELFVNYDCDPDRTDLCEDMVGLLSRNALPDSATWSTTSVPPLCLDALLRYVHFMAERLDDAPSQPVGYIDPAALRDQRKRKQLIMKGTTSFNEKPSEGLKELANNGIISSAQDPKAVAKFLRSTSRVSKKVLGDFLSKKGKEDFLAEFMNTFDFGNKRVDEALRLVLEAFRLPGEAPLISNIVTAFSERYCAGTIPEDVADQDSVFVLTYAIIMLNVDQHSPNVRGQKRMNATDFSRNLRGQNGGKDFAFEYLQAIYDAISTNEIILPEEHDNKTGFDYAWRELLLKTESAGLLIECDTNIYDADMFAATWRPIVSMLSYVFMSATDDTVFNRVVAGFDDCARVAAKYGNIAALDQIISSLSQMTTLATDMVTNTRLNTEVQVEDKSVMVSELAVKLGRDYRAQLATLVLFRVMTNNEAMIRKGWTHISRIWLNLFVNSLIPAFSVSESESFSLPPMPLQTPSQVIDRAAKANEAGFFSSFANYISSYAADDPPEPSDEELESTLCTVDLVIACRISNVSSSIQSLPLGALEALVDGLLSHIPEDDGGNGVVITVQNGDGTQRPDPSGPSEAVNSGYDPTLVYILELSTALAVRDSETVDLLGERVADALQTVLRDASRYHPIVLSRTTYYLFNLLSASYEHDFIRAPVLLHTVFGFSKDTLKKTSDLVLKGLQACVEKPGPLRNEIMTSPDFWAILRIFATTKASAPLAFSILETGVSPSSTAVMADNYEAAVNVLNQFASAASEGLVKEPRVDRNKTRPARPPPAKMSNDESAAAIGRGVKAIQIIYSFTSRIPALMEQSHLEDNEAWGAYWLPIFLALTTQCTNQCREVRQLAFSFLQSTLLSKELTKGDHQEWTAIFGQVLFPLIKHLLGREVFIADPVGMSETRIQAASLLCKVFLQYLFLLSEWEGMLKLWMDIIDIMRQLMESGHRDSLEEAVLENLKNVLLFMSSSGYLVPPSRDPSKAELWRRTWEKIDQFLPELRRELALDDPAAEKEEVAAAAAPNASAAPVVPVLNTEGKTA